MHTSDRSDRSWSRSSRSSLDYSIATKTMHTSDRSDRSWSRSSSSSLDYSIATKTMRASDRSDRSWSRSWRSSLGYSIGLVTQANEFQSRCLSPGPIYTRLFLKSIARGTCKEWWPRLKELGLREVVRQATIIIGGCFARKNYHVNSKYEINWVTGIILLCSVSVAWVI